MKTHPFWRKPPKKQPDRSCHMCHKPIQDTEGYVANRRGYEHLDCHKRVASEEKLKEDTRVNSR